MQDPIMFLISFSGIGICIFLTILLIGDFKKSASKVFVALILMFFIPLFSVYPSVYNSQNKEENLSLSLVGIALFFIAPLLYEYVKSIYQGNKKLNLYFNWIFFPGIVAIFVTICSELLNVDHRLLLIISGVLTILSIGYLLFLLLLIHRMKKRNQKALLQNYASLPQVNLYWINIWVYGLLIFILIDLLTSLMLTVFPDFGIIIYLNLCYLVGLVGYIGYFGIRQVNVFLSIDDSKTDVSPKRIQESANIHECGNNEFVKLRIDLDNAFVKNELYKIENISLRRTAELINTSDKKLSFLLNQCMKVNFYEYVNRLRFEEFIGKVKKGEAESKTILALAYESGFNSKSTFNRVFKQMTGKTPKVFVSELRPDKK